MNVLERLYCRLAWRMIYAEFWAEKRQMNLGSEWDTERNVREPHQSEWVSRESDAAVGSDGFLLHVCVCASMHMCRVSLPWLVCRKEKNGNPSLFPSPSLLPLLHLCLSLVCLSVSCCLSLNCFCYHSSCCNNYNDKTANIILLLSVLSPQYSISRQLCAAAGNWTVSCIDAPVAWFSDCAVVISCVRIIWKGVSVDIQHASFRYHHAQTSPEGWPLKEFHLLRG